MKSSLCFLALIASATTGFCAGDPLVGSTHLQAQAEVIRFGDKELRDIVGEGYGFGLSGNLPLAPRLDAQATASRVWADGSHNGVKSDFDTTNFQLAAVLWIPVKGAIHPFATVHGDYFNTDGTFTSADGEREQADDSEWGGGAEVGAEVTLASSTWARVSGGFLHSDSEDSTDVEGELGFWITPSVLASLGLDYEFEGEDVIGTAYLTRRF